ncbi:MAG TPA: SpoIIE family protein phosphatase [Solirubrobacteraceae bacterium]|nr:SpoIIE family protein phosphatase [Solirubrobacteraceae bacterium]
MSTARTAATSARSGRQAASRGIAGVAAGGSLGLAGSTRRSASLRGSLGSDRHVQYSAGNVLASLAGRRMNFIPALIGNLVPLPVPDWSKPIIVLLLLVILFMAVRALRSSRHTRRLESQRIELAADLDSMQAALVPAIPEQLGALGLSVAYRPADGPAAGGDFYDAFPLDDGRVAVIVGDVSGHGRTALARAAHMHYTLRAYVETGLDPRASLKLAGRVLGTDDDGLFTTVAIAIYDPASATLTYATAGHPPPVVLGADVGDPVAGSASPALGWGLPTGLRQTTLAFGAGSRACFFSDGVTEARTENGLLGRERLKAMFASFGSSPAAPELLERVRAEATAVTDDMAACVIEARQGRSPLTRRIEELEVNAEALAAGQGERFLHGCGVAARDIAHAVEEARALADAHGAAMLRVAVGPDGPVVAVHSAPLPVLGTPAPRDRAQADAMAAAGRTRSGDEATSGPWAGHALPLSS